MIVSMDRIAVVGPRRLHGSVVKEIQDLGAVHVDQVRPTTAGVELRALAGDEQAARDAIDGVRTRAEAILALLPVMDTPPVRTAAYAEQTPEVLRSRLDGLEAEVKELTRRLLESEEEQEILRAYGRAIDVLSPLLLLLENSRSLEAIGFVLEAKPGALEAVRADLGKATQGRVEVVSRPVDDHHLGAVAAFGRDDVEAVRAVLARAGVTELRLPASVRGLPPGQAVSYLQARVQDLPQIIEDLRQKLLELSRRHRAEVAAIAMVARDEVHRFEVMSQLPQSRYAFALYGWVPTGRVPLVREGLQTRFGREVVIYAESAPTFHADHVPVLLDNPGWLKPFELFLRIFDPPKYGTFDPTIVFAIFLPLWVGYIIGDLGYGLILLAITLALSAKARAGGPWRVVLAGIDFGFTLTPVVTRRVVALLTWMTAWTFVFGIVFGEFFGNLPDLIFPGFSEHWVIFNRQTNQIPYFYSSVGFGLVQVYLGLYLGLMKAVRHRDRHEILETVAQTTGATAMFLWIATQAHILSVSVFGPVMVGAAAAFLLCLVLRFELANLMWVMEAISTFGAIISYARLFALGIASLDLATLSNTLGASLPVVIAGIPVGAVGHATFFILTILGHVIQPARLHWVEFFSRFRYYQDTGRPYSPFQHSGGEV